MGGLPTSTVNGFAANPSNAQVMYVGMRDGVFRTENGGWAWTAVPHAPKNVAAIAVNPKNSRELYAATMDGSIVRSTDGGAQWSARRWIPLSSPGTAG